MDIRQCERCSRLFQFRGNRKCPACVQEADNMFVEVRNYLDEHPAASIEDVCEACDVEESDLLSWLREGRLILSQDSIPRLDCQRCHTPIQNGRYCDECAVKMLGQLENTALDISRREDKGKRSHVQIAK